MLGFFVGLAVALGGALLLAGGSELQSRAVYVADGRWSRFIRNPFWLLGLLLLGVAVSTNFIALALAPISAVQSMSIVGLAASTTYGAITGRIRVTPQVKLSVVACLVGILGFIVVIASHRTDVAHHDLERLLPIVMAIQIIVAAAGVVIACVSRRTTDKTTHMAGLIMAAVEFGTITATFKVLVGLVLAHGLGEVLSRPVTILALLFVAIGGAIAGTQFQLAHRVLPAPTVVAGLTITETLTAAAIGTLLLQESALTPEAGLLVLLFGGIAIGGVVGMRNLQRTTDVPACPEPELAVSHTG